MDLAGKNDNKSACLMIRFMPSPGSLFASSRRMCSLLGLLFAGTSSVRKKSFHGLPHSGSKSSRNVSSSRSVAVGGARPCSASSWSSASRMGWLLGVHDVQRDPRVVCLVCLVQSAEADLVADFHWRQEHHACPVAPDALTGKSPCSPTAAALGAAAFVEDTVTQHVISITTSPAISRATIARGIAHPLAYAVLFQLLCCATIENAS